jgi:transposase
LTESPGLHARKMYVSIVDEAGTLVAQRNLDACPERFLALIRPYRTGLVVGCECMFAWYWLADLCRDEGIDFVLGHALYMKAIHGDKTKNDRIDSEKIARLEKKHGKAKALAILAAKLARAVYWMLKRQEAFNVNRCFR